jgi:hypothetical protein
MDFIPCGGAVKGCEYCDCEVEGHCPSLGRLLKAEDFDVDSYDDDDDGD